MRFKKVKYFITEGDSPLELCLEKLGTVNSAVTVEVSSSDGSATGKNYALVLCFSYNLFSFIRLHSSVQPSDHISAR